MAKEGAKHNVRANVICPGFVMTPLVQKQIPEQAKELGISEERVVKEVMLGETVDKEFTTVDDIAEIALLLAAFKTNALTGESLDRQPRLAHELNACERCIARQSAAPRLSVNGTNARPRRRVGRTSVCGSGRMRPDKPWSRRPNL